jgi:hypothetical protein
VCTYVGADSAHQQQWDRVRELLLHTTTRVRVLLLHTTTTHYSTHLVPIPPPKHTHTNEPIATESGQKENSVSGQKGKKIGGNTRFEKKMARKGVRCHTHTNTHTHTHTHTHFIYIYWYSFIVPAGL